jgi:hypothetical protein
VARPCRLACLVVPSRYSRRSSLPIDNHSRMSKAKRYKAEDKASKVRHHSICAFLYTLGSELAESSGCQFCL